MGLNKQLNRHWGGWMAIKKFKNIKNDEAQTALTNEQTKDSQSQPNLCSWERYAENFI